MAKRKNAVSSSATLTIRIPVALKRDLHAAAAADDRTITSYVVRAVREQLMRDDAEQKASRAGELKSPAYRAHNPARSTAGARK